MSQSTRSNNAKNARGASATTATSRSTVLSSSQARRGELTPAGTQGKRKILTMPRTMLSPKTAQNAIEFLAMLSVLMLVFIALFGFVVQQYGAGLVQKDATTLQKLLEDIRSEVRQALFAPDGYDRTFYVQDHAIANPYTLTLRNSGEIYVNDTRGYQQILFLKPEEYVRGNLCTQKNDILKSADYGIGVCCNSCNGTIPGVIYGLALECKTNNSAYWDICTNMTAASNWSQVRVNCSIWMTGANFTIYNQTNSQLLLTTSSNTTLVRNLTNSWVWLTMSTGIILKSATTYNVSATCYNATSSYIQTGNFAIT